MAVLSPLQLVTVNPPPTIATSVYSPGGAGYNSVNSFNNTPIAAPNNQYLYGNPYANNQYSMAPQGQSDGYGSIISNASNLKSAGQFVGNGFQLPQSATLNSVGAGLGFAPGTLSYTTAGALPWQTAGAIANPAMAGQAGVAATQGTSSILGGSTLSSSLGAAGIGALAGNFLGKIGGSELGGSIGGGLGAGIGFAVGGPVGGVIGGLVGGIGGGFFGNKKPPTSASEFAGGLDTSGTLGGFSYGAKNAQSYSGYNQSLSNEMASYMNEAKQYLGLNEYKPISIRGGVNTRHSPSGQAGYLMVGDQTFGFNPDDDASRQQAIGQAVAYMAKNSGATDEQIKNMSNQLAYNATPQGQARKFMPFVPIKNDQKFADYMSKFKSQNTVSGTNAPTNTANNTNA